MKMIVPIIMVFIVFTVVFSNTPFSITDFLEDLQYETHINSQSIVETTTKFKVFGEQAEATFNSWKGEYNVQGKWQWQDYVAYFFVGVWNTFTDVLNTLTQFGTVLVMGAWYLGMVLIDIMNITVLGFKYLVGVQV